MGIAQTTHVNPHDPMQKTLFPDHACCKPNFWAHRVNGDSATRPCKPSPSYAILTSIQLLGPTESMGIAQTTYVNPHDPMDKKNIVS